MRLNQVVAVVTGTKTQAVSEITAIHKKSMSADLMSGISRQYKPKDEEGERLPSESKYIQYTTDAALHEAREVWSKVWDMVATQDEANAKAFADVIVDGKILIEGVNILHLLYLEKQLNDVKTFINKLPTLDPADKWEWSNEQAAYTTEPYETTRTKKIPRNHVKAEATEHHPAQVEVYMEDVIVGTWSTIKYSGAITTVNKRQILERIVVLQEAVKKAREEANMVEVANVKEADVILDYLFER